MSASKRPDQTSPKVALEGAVKRDNRGRPANPMPLKSILRRMPSVAEFVEKDGVQGSDLTFLAKLLVLQHAILLQTVYRDDEVDLLRKVEVANKALGIIDKLRDGWRDPNADKAKYPHTETELDGELAKRLKQMQELDKAIKDPDPKVAEQIFERLTPVQLEEQV